MPGTAIEMSHTVTATSPPYDQPQKKGKIWKLLVRWLWTLVFIIFIFMIAKIYLAKGNITKSQKATFNLIQTVLILALGLNIFVSDDESCTIEIYRSCCHRKRSRSLLVSRKGGSKLGQDVMIKNGSL